MISDPAFWAVPLGAGAALLMVFLRNRMTASPVTESAAAPSPATVKAHPTATITAGPSAVLPVGHAARRVDGATGGGPPPLAPVCWPDDQSRPHPDGTAMLQTLDLMPAPCVVVRPSGQVIAANHLALDLWRLSETEMIGRDAATLYEDFQDRHRVTATLIEQGGLRNHRVRLKRTDGTPLWASLSTRVMMIDGTPAFCTLVCDLTEPEEKRRVQASETALLRSVIEAMPGGLCLFDSDARAILFNSSFAELWQVPSTVLHVGTSLETLVRHTVESGLRAPIDAHRVASRAISRLAAGREIIDEVPLSDGRTLEFRGSTTAGGSFVFTSIDITRRKQAEAALGEMFEAAPVPMALLALPGSDILMVNRRLEERLGVGRDAVRGRDANLFYARSGDRRRFATMLQRDGRVEGLECPFRTMDGQVFWATMQATRLRWRGRDCLLVGLHDTTERRAGEEALRAAKEQAEKAVANLRAAQDQLVEAEKMASLGQLVAGVAHEINTPVGTAMTAASLLAERTRTFQERVEGGQLKRSDLDRYLDLASGSSTLLMSNLERAAGLIASFKRVAVDQASEERRTFDLGAYIRDVLTSLAPRLRNTPVSVRLDCPETVILDSFPGAWSQVVTNLVLNAVDHAFTPGQNGSVTLSVQAVPMPSSGSGAGAEDGERTCVTLVVADDGCGMPADVAGRVFEPFYTTRRGHGGSGLGLPIVWNIVTSSLCGTIQLETAVGKGSAFSVRVPCRTDGNTIRMCECSDQQKPPQVPREQAGWRDQGALLSSS